MESTPCRERRRRMEPARRNWHLRAYGSLRDVRRGMAARFCAGARCGAPGFGRLRRSLAYATRRLPAHERADALGALESQPSAADPDVGRRHCVVAWTRPKIAACRLRRRCFFSMPQLIDPNFARTVLLLCEHAPEGAFGLIVNRPSEIPAAAAVRLDPPVEQPNELPLLLGGPVEPERGWILTASRTRGRRVAQRRRRSLRLGLAGTASSCPLGAAAASPHAGAGRIRRLGARAARCRTGRIGVAHHAGRTGSDLRDSGRRRHGKWPSAVWAPTRICSRWDTAFTDRGEPEPRRDPNAERGRSTEGPGRALVLMIPSRNWRARSSFELPSADTAARRTAVFARASEIDQHGRGRGWWQRGDGGDAAPLHLIVRVGLHGGEHGRRSGRAFAHAVLIQRLTADGRIHVRP